MAMWERVRASQPTKIDLAPTQPPTAPAELALKQCVDLAFRNNADFRRSLASLAGGREQLWVADQSLFYRANSTLRREDAAGGSLSTSASAGASLGWEGVSGDSLRLGINSGTSPLGDLFREQPSLELAYDRPLLRGAGAASSRAELLRGARSALLSAQLAFYDDRQDLVLQITEAYFATVLAVGELDIAAKAVDRAYQFYSMNYNKFTGEGDPLTGEGALKVPGEQWVSQVREIDVSQARLSWESAKQNLISQQQAVRDATDRLLLAMGLSPGAEPKLVTTAAYEPQHYDEAQLCNAAIANSTRLALLNLARQDNLAAVRLARSAARPDLIASVGVLDLGDTGDVAASDHRGWFAGLRLEIPIAQRSLSAGINSARRSLQVFDQAQTSARESIVQEMKRLVRAASTAQAQIEIGEQSLNLARKSREQMSEMYSEGLVSYLDVLDAEDRLVQAERSQLRKKTDYFLTSVRIRRALGEDLLPWLPE